MASIIRNPKDGIDETIERLRAIDTMLSREPQIDSTKEARGHLEDAVNSLSLARDQVRRNVKKTKVA